MKEKDTAYNADVTKEDLKTLGDKAGNLRNDNGDDFFLKNRKSNVDFSGSDLDIPGRVEAKKQTRLKPKDEENQLYSLGSEDNENLEIDTITYNDKNQ
jgi:hypothetical protein